MEYFDPNLFNLVYSFIFGLLFGSFATMASYRIPKKEDLIKKPSRCPKCNHRLGILDLFPIFSWALSGAKCRHCKSKIHWRYPAIEIVTAILFTIAYVNLGPTLQGMFVLLSILYLVIFFTIKLEDKLKTSKK